MCNFPYIKLASTVTRGHSAVTDAMKLSKIKMICLDISRAVMDTYKKKVVYRQEIDSYNQHDEVSGYLWLDMFYIVFYVLESL